MGKLEKLEFEKIKKRWANLPPTPWRWGDWETSFGEREPAELLERRTLEHHPKILQFSGGLRRTDDEPIHILTVQDELDSYDLAIALAKAPEDIATLITEVEKLKKEKP